MSFQTTGALPGFPADAATPLGSDPPPRQRTQSSHTTALAVAASEAGNRFHGGPVEGIAPVGGWALCRHDEQDGDGFLTDAYYARGATHDVPLAVSRFHFHPTQARFAWLVRSGFPAAVRGQGDCLCPFADADIDAAIAAELGMVAA